jgi:hypothetical protein
VARKKGYVIYTGEYLSLSNTSITDVPTLHDWLPWGITMEKTVDGRVRNVPPFTENNFCFYASGATEDGKHTISSSGCFAPQGGKIWKISIDEKWYMVSSALPVRYDDGDKYPHPTVYTDPAGPFVMAISYNQPERRWVFQFHNQDNTFSYQADLAVRGVTNWVGKPEGPFMMMSIGSPKKRNVFEVWGGFVQFSAYTGTLKHPEFGELMVKGLGWSDREYHKIVPASRAGAKRTGNCPPINYWALSIMQDDVDIATYYCTEPWTGEVRAQAGRINFQNKGVGCEIEEFTTTDNGGVNASEFRIKGKHERGTLDIVGRVKERVGFHSKEFLETGQWGPTPAKCLVDGMQVAFWQVFVDWEGEVTLDGERIKVSAERSPSEVTKMQEPPSGMEPPHVEGSEVEWVYE